MDTNRDLQRKIVLESLKLRAYRRLVASPGPWSYRQRPEVKIGNLQSLEIRSPGWRGLSTKLVAAEVNAMSAYG